MSKPNQLQAPEGLESIVVEGATYEPDAKGLVTVHVPHHEPVLRQHGFTAPGSRKRATVHAPEPVAQAEPAKPVEPAPAAEPDRAPAVPNVFRFLESKGLIDGTDFVRDISAVALLTKVDELMAPPPALPNDPDAMNYDQMKAFLRERGIQFAANPAKDILKKLVRENKDTPPVEVA